MIEPSGRLNNTARISSSITMGLRLSSIGVRGFVGINARLICAGSKLSMAKLIAVKKFCLSCSIYSSSTPLLKKLGPQRP